MLQVVRTVAWGGKFYRLPLNKEKIDNEIVVELKHFGTNDQHEYSKCTMPKPNQIFVAYAEFQLPALLTKSLFPCESGREI